MLGSEIRNLVLAKLDEYTPYGPDNGRTLLAGGDSLIEVKPVYKYLELHLAEAANEKLMEVPIHRLRYKESSPSAVADTNDNRIGDIALPSDFLRLHTLRMKGWTFPIHESYYPGHPVYENQKYEWTRGNIRKPVAIVTGLGEVVSSSSNTTVKKLHYYSVAPSDTHEVLDFKYISKFESTTDYDDKVAEVIALNAARKICEAFGMTEQIGILTGEMNAVMENMRL